MEPTGGIARSAMHRRLNNWQTVGSHARFETQTRQVEDATTMQLQDAHKGAKFATDNVVSETRSETLRLSRRRSNEPTPDSLIDF